MMKYIKGDIYINSIVASSGEIVATALSGICNDKLGTRLTLVDRAILSQLGAGDGAASGIPSVGDPSIDRFSDELCDKKGMESYTSRSSLQELLPKFGSILGGQSTEIDVFQLFNQSFQFLRLLGHGVHRLAKFRII